MLQPKIYVKDKNKVYDTQVIDYKNKIVIFFDNETQCTYTRLFDEVEFMENTGAKDKNGNYVYSGDIVKDNDDVYTIKRSEVYKIFSIGNRKGYLFLDESRCREVEVIGNIYENKELLEKC